MTTYNETRNDVQNNPCEDCLLIEALKSAVQEGSVSITMLQRRLNIGFSRAGRLVDLLKKHGFIENRESVFPVKCLLVARTDAEQDAAAAASMQTYEAWADGLLRRAARFAVEEQQISVTMLQRRLAIGYARARRLAEQLVECGVIERGDPGCPYICRATMGELDTLLQNAGKNI